jgi:hypothetical protein
MVKSPTGKEKDLECFEVRASEIGTSAPFVLFERFGVVRQTRSFVYVEVGASVLTNYSQQFGREHETCERTRILDTPSAICIANTFDH